MTQQLTLQCSSLGIISLTLAKPVIPWVYYYFEVSDTLNEGSSNNYCLQSVIAEKDYKSFWLCALFPLMPLRPFLTFLKEWTLSGVMNTSFPVWTFGQSHTAWWHKLVLQGFLARFFGVVFLSRIKDLFRVLPFARDLYWGLPNSNFSYITINCISIITYGIYWKFSALIACTWGDY